VGNILANYIWLTGDPESLNRSFALFERVTPEDIQRVAKQYFINDKRTVVTLSAEEEGR
jgi:zinc protease